MLAQLEKQKQALKGKEVQLAQLRKAEAERQAKLAAAERARKLFLATRPGKVISMARQYLGVPYVWGGSSPKGFDCSGLVMYVYAKVGVKLPHSSRMMFNMRHSGLARQPQGRRPGLLLHPHRARGHLHRQRQDDQCHGHASADKRRLAEDLQRRPRVL